MKSVVGVGVVEARHALPLLIPPTSLIGILLCVGLFIPTFCSTINAVWGKDFVLVIDPGHGGRDPGAIGKISKEKNINLTVALKLGDLIKKNCKDVRVVYTRNTDVFIPLDRRAEIANNEKADLFISIHTNALPGKRSIQGASTWTLGLARSEENLAVAKSENAVMLYEDDYKTRYAGFDPNLPESGIIFDFIQDQYMMQSVRLASLIQQQFGKSCNRKDLGVRQAGFWVLKATAMPSALVELGFISTLEEERFLNTEGGTSSMAKGIYNAFLIYKKESEVKLSSSGETLPTKPSVNLKPIKTDTFPIHEKPAISSAGEIIFKVQFLTSTRLLPHNHAAMKGLKEVEHYAENRIYKYTYGASPDYNKVLKTKGEVAMRFKDAFVVAFDEEGVRMNIHQAIEIFKEKER
ncbi:N-acetylmuramoyl-L-alanine amidase AmiC [termite gut metagenome]|uniref:N-acetylmuramoyl-L-alanine amidase AmiC n=1 Tax=termite gut metagenome TaxID=433724 RepID=A0A5J4SW86_9ZZZZ